MELEQVLEKNRTLHHMMQKATVDALDFQNAAEQLHSLLQCSVYIINKEGTLLGCKDWQRLRPLPQPLPSEPYCLCRSNKRSRFFS